MSQDSKAESTRRRNPVYHILVCMSPKRESGRIGASFFTLFLNCACVCVHMSASSCKSQEALVTPGAGVTEGYELLDLSTEDQAQVLTTCSKPLNHLSSPGEILLVQERRLNF